MQFREFLTILASRWKTVVVSLLLVLAATAAVTLRMTPVYESSTRVFFAAQSTAQGGYVLTANDLATYEQLISSPVVMEPLREELGLPADTDLSLTATGSEGSSMMDITARSNSAQVAADAATAAGPQLASIGMEFAPLLNSAGQSVTVTTITPAAVPGRPVSPDLVQNLVLGLLAGVALGVGLALLRHFLDTRVRGEQDIRAVSDRPLLGKLRQFSKSDGNALVLETDPHGLAAEEYRRLRTNLQFADITTGGKHSFAVSSVMPGEGKTTTAVNLAIAFADSGARVLLVDADMRNPSVAAAMGLEGSVGLTSVLLGRVSADDAAQRWGDSTLWVLPAGAIPPNPSELLGSTAMESLFQDLLASYDYVLVDCPPVLPVVDPVLIDRLVGGMLMVVSVNSTLKRDLTQAVRQLETVEAKISGFALNRMPNDDSVSRYGGYYAYGRSRKDRKKRAKVHARQGSLEQAVPVSPAGLPNRPETEEVPEVQEAPVAPVAPVHRVSAPTPPQVLSDDTLASGIPRVPAHDWSTDGSPRDESPEAFGQGPAQAAGPYEPQMQGTPSTRPNGRQRSKPGHGRRFAD